MSTQLNDAMKKFNKNNSLDELIEACQNQPYTAGIPSHEIPIFIDYIKELIFIKNQENLLKEQNDFNTKILKDNHKMIKNNQSLSKATWILAIFTIILAIVSIVSLLIAYKEVSI